MPGTLTFALAHDGGAFLEAAALFRAASRDLSHAISLPRSSGTSAGTPPSGAGVRSLSELAPAPVLRKAFHEVAEVAHAAASAWRSLFASPPARTVPDSAGAGASHRADAGPPDVAASTTDPLLDARARNQITAALQNAFNAPAAWDSGLQPEPRASALARIGFVVNPGAQSSNDPLRDLARQQLAELKLTNRLLQNLPGPDYRRQ